MFNKNNFNKIILPEIIIFTAFIVVLYIANNIQYMQYEKTVNEKIAEIAMTVKEKYPDVTDSELIETIKNGKNLDKNFLTKYGYTTDTRYIESIEENRNTTIAVNLILAICFETIAMVLFIIYKNNQKKQINEIDQYLRKLNDKNYQLKIQDNGEDEISKLRNELYKTTVLLKEVAENNEKERKQLSNSLADISHQIKTPLTSIRIMLDNICDNPDMDEKTKQEFVQDISKQIDWISSLVIALLKLARFDAGAIEMNDKEFCVKDFIDDIISNLSVLLDIKNIEIVVNIDKSIKATLDYNWQKEAVTNIVKNAIEHSNENSRIYISAESSSLFLKIKIRDEGEGISKEEKKHIFERFYKSNKSSENSIGIGLALSKTIIEKDNGDIKVSSEKGQGTTFEIEYLR